MCDNEFGMLLGDLEDEPLAKRAARKKPAPKRATVDGDETKETGREPGAGHASTACCYPDNAT